MDVTDSLVQSFLATAEPNWNSREGQAVAAVVRNFLVGFAVKFEFHDRDLRRDLVQDVFESLVEKSQVSDASRVRATTVAALLTWCKTNARNKFKDWYRANKPVGQRGSDYPSADQGQVPTGADGEAAGQETEREPGGGRHVQFLDTVHSKACDATALNQLEEQAESRAVRQTIEALAKENPRQARVLELDLCNPPLTSEEIAHDVGVKVGNLYQLRRRAKQRFERIYQRMLAQQALSD